MEKRMVVESVLGRSLFLRAVPRGLVFLGGDRASRGPGGLKGLLTYFKEIVSRRWRAALM